MIAIEIQGPKVHVDSGEERSQVAFGGVRATRFIKDVVAGRLVNGKKYSFNSDFVLDLQRRLLPIDSGVSPGIRKVNLVTVSGKEVASAVEVYSRFPLFCRWLEEETEKMKDAQDDIVKALEVAAGAHYGLVMPELHPFENGNGRTARALMNAILMSQSYELTAFGLAIPPVPILRSVGDNRYVRSLQTVDETGDLRPFMVFIAQRWADSVRDRLERITHGLEGHRTGGDLRLILKLEWRELALRNFIEKGEGSLEGDRNGNGNGSRKKNGKTQSYRRHPIPDYFGLRYIKTR